MTASSILARCVGLLFAIFASDALATPYLPRNDSEILERLPGGAGSSERAMRALRALTARDPGDLDLSLRLAGIYVARARSESDPRQLGRAQAVLARWWNEDDPPVPVLVLRATIAQSNHAFASARTDLERAVARDPANAQAWLTLATVQQVTGDLSAAADSCGRFSGIAAAIVAVTCQAGVDGLSGRAAQAYDALADVLAKSSNHDGVALRTWATTLQAELAERLARPADAERLYRASLELDPQDAYAIAAYADFLIDAGRYADVTNRIAQDTPVDTLLLRRVQAATRAGTVDAARSAQDLAERFAALRARGERVHLREEARYALEIRRTPDAALALALDNWRVQKEPLDARIVLESALAAGQPQAAGEVLDWIASTHLQGDPIASLARQARRP